MSLEEQLINAVIEGDIKKVRSLLDQGADVNARNSYGNIALCYASCRKNIEVVKLLLQHGADVEIKNHDNNTSLHDAAIVGNTEAAQLLLDREANVNVSNNLGQTPLHCTAERQSEGVAKLLLQHEADIDAIDNNGRTPLCYAAERESVGVAKLLFASGAKVDTQGYLALYMAAALGNKEKIKSLLDQPEISIDIRTLKKCTLLHLAAQNEDTEVAEFLLKNGAEVDAIDTYKSTPLHYAVRGNNIKVVELFLKNRANVNYHGSSKYTPLHYAAKNGNEEMAALLLQCGADINAQDSQGYTALHLAVIYASRIVPYLLDQGAKVNVKNIYGYTPPDYIVSDSYIIPKDEKNNLFILLLYGADISAEERKKVKWKYQLARYLAEFEQVKAMPHLGKLIEANKSKDKKESVRIIASYINNEAEGQELIKEFETIKEKYGSNEQLSFIPEHVLDFVEQITMKFLKFHIDEKTIADQLHRSKDDIQVTKKFKEEVQNIYENLPKIVSEKIVSYFDNDTKKNVLLALSKKADEFLNKLKNICQNPNTALAASQIESSAKLQRMDR